MGFKSRTSGANGASDNVAFQRLARRLNNPPKRVNNASLYAGSPMYFYCELCAHLAATLPENYTTKPPKYCKECGDLKAAFPGMTDATLAARAIA
jgi:hypothetical protein